MNKAELMLEALRAFNRKERYHVLREAVIGGPMTLTGSFREKLKDALEWESDIPEDAFVAMDYHLDWISAAYQMGAKGSRLPESPQRYENRPNDKGKPVIGGSIEDVDLLVAYRKEDKVVLICIEAKADTSWDIRQLSNKGQRIRSIFGRQRKGSSLVEPWFVLMGPNSPASLEKKIKENIKHFPSFFFSGTSNRHKGKMPYLDIDIGSYGRLLSIHRVGRGGSEEKYPEWEVKPVTTFEPDNKKGDED